MFVIVIFSTLYQLYNLRMGLGRIVRDTLIECGNIPFWHHERLRVSHECKLAVLCESCWSAKQKFSKYYMKPNQSFYCRALTIYWNVNVCEC